MSDMGMNRRHFLQTSLAAAAALLLRRQVVQAGGEFVLFMWSGGLTSSSIRVKARLMLDSTTVRLVVSTQSNLSNPIYSSYAAANSSNNRVANLTLSGLNANTDYHYTIEANGQWSSLRGRFHTPTNGPFSFSFACASCAVTGSSHAVFDTIRQNNPLFFIHLGDFHYENIGINDPNLFRQAYNTVLASITQSALYRRLPLVYTWDDHDYGPNDSDGTSASRLAARQTYQEYVPHYPLVAGSGDVPIYQAFTIGRVRFIVTDNRSERTPKTAPDNAAKSILGTTQKAWLKQQLLAARDVYPLIVWVCATPWHSGPAFTDGDDFSGYTAERRELADFMYENRIRNLCVVSGDIHMVGLEDGTNSRYGREGMPGFPILQAAALDHPLHTSYGNVVYSHGQFPGGGQFGLVTITDTGGETVQVRLSGRNADNTELTGLTWVSPPPPRLWFHPATLWFYEANGIGMLSRPLTLSNIGIANLNYQINTSATWLTAQPTSGLILPDEPHTSTVTINPTSLPLGQHTAMLTLTSPEATNSPQTIDVTFLKTDEPPIFLPLQATPN